MGAIAEGDMLVGRAIDLELEWVVEDGFVAVAGWVGEEEPGLHFAEGTAAPI